MQPDKQLGQKLLGREGWTDKGLRHERSCSVQGTKGGEYGWSSVTGNWECPESLSQRCSPERGLYLGDRALHRAGGMGRS